MMHAAKCRFRKITVISSCFVLLVSVIVAFSCLYPFYSFHQQEKKRDIDDHFKSQLNVFKGHFNRLKELSSLVSSRTTMRDIFDSYQKGEVSRNEFLDISTPRFNDAKNSVPGILGITRWTPDAQDAITAGVKTPGTLLKESSMGKVLLSSFRLGNGKEVIVSYSPVIANDGRLIGTDTIVFDPESLRNGALTLVNAKTVFSSSGILAVDEGGAVHVFNLENRRLPEELFLRIAKKRKTSDGELLSDMCDNVFKKDGEYYLCGPVTSENGTVFYLLASVNEDVLSAFADEKLLTICLIVALSSIFFYVLISELLRPIEIRLLDGIRESVQLGERLQREVREHEMAGKLFKDSESRFRIFMDNIPCLVFLKDDEGRFVYINDYFKKCGLADTDEWIGKKDSEVWPSVKVDSDRSFEERIIQGNQNFSSIEDLAMGNRTRRFATCRFPIVTDSFSKSIGGVSFDITEIVKMENELLKEKERLSLTLLSISDGVIVTDSKRKILMINKAACGIAECTEGESIGKDLMEIFKIYQETSCVQLEIEDIEKPVNGTGPMHREKIFSLEVKGGARKHIEYSYAHIKDRKGDSMGAVIVFRDITLSRKMEENIFRNQKIESLCMLAGGVAHDFNNILTGIIGNIGLARMLSNGDGSEISDILLDAEKSSSRAMSLTQKLLVFAGGGNPSTTECSLRALVEDNVQLCLAGSNVKYSLGIPDDLWSINADPSLISQVISSIILNVKQAMPDSGGELDVSAENINICENDYPSLSAGKYVKVSFADNGSGIEPGYKDKYFEPYFTTKTDSHGLDLSMSYSIISKHGGFIGIEHNPSGKGTVCYFLLPASGIPFSGSVEYEKIPDLSKAGRSDSPRKILIMDDELSISKSTKKILEKLGHRAETAKNGEEAVDIYKEAIRNSDPFDFVILDLTIIGGMGGRETIKILKEINPEIDAVVSSGYSNDLTKAALEECGFKFVLAKPYTTGDLRKIVDSLS